MTEQTVAEREIEAGRESRFYLVYDEKTLEAIEPLKEDERFRDVLFVSSDRLREEGPGEGDRLLLCVSYPTLKRLLVEAERERWILAVSPGPQQKALERIFGVSDSAQAIEVLREREPRPFDLLYAGEEPVLFHALVGEAPPLEFRSSRLSEASEGKRIGSFFSALAKLRRLRMALLKLETAKGQQITTAATGIVVFAEGDNTCAANLLQERSYNDGQLRAVILSPRSVISYIHYLLVALFPIFRQRSLPASVGLVKSEALAFESDPAMRVVIDARECGETPVRFAVHPKAIRLCAPEEFWQRNEPSKAEKETLRLEHLPQTDEAVSYARKTLPLFSHATEQEYKELFASLREDGHLSSTFVILMIFSTLLASNGLFLNSASVVIGAMLLAPLMQPIISFSMGVLRWDPALSLPALRTVGVGTALVLVSSALIAWMLPFRELTAEMSGRLHPSLLDLLVAIVSGMAAAYAKNNSRISGSLVGVAIAVALVPPLATAGIGIGWNRFAIFEQAFLLFLTNFAGIVLAAGFVFMIMGFSPIRRARRGLAVGLATVALVMLPLTLTYRQMAEDSRVLHRLNGQIFVIDGAEVRIGRARIRHEERDVLVCDLVVAAPLNERELHQLQKRIEKRLGRSLVLEALQRIRLEELDRNQSGNGKRRL